MFIYFIIFTTILQHDPGPYINLNGLKDFNPVYVREYSYISINRYYFNPNEKLPEIPPELRGKSDYYLIHFKGPVYEDMKRTIESYGVKLIQYIPFNAYITRMDESKVGLIKDLPIVNWVGDYEPAYKLSLLFDELKDEKRMLILLFYNEDISIVVNKLKTMNCKILEVTENEYNKIIKIETERSNFVKIARLSEIMYVEPRLEPILCNADAQWV